MKNALIATIIGLAFVVGVMIAANSYKNRSRANDSIKVTGLGAQDFTSDLIVWEAAFHRKSMNLQEAYTNLEKDRRKVKEFLQEKGIDQSEVVFSAVDIRKDIDYQYDQNGYRMEVFTGHILTQRVEIESNEVELIEEASRAITDLINRGVEIDSYRPDYYYTKLAELKIEMIAAATEDARVRAEKIAENAGSNLGELHSAQMGIFQIIGQNSNEDYSWGGTYNTSSKMKTATITMRLSFGVE